jgi:membrane protein
MTNPSDAEHKSFSGTVFHLFRQTFQEWLDDKAPQLGAALAYYTVFSLAPLTLLVLAIIGFLFRDDPAGAWNRITEQLSYFLDQSAVETVQGIAQRAGAPGQERFRNYLRNRTRALRSSGCFRPTAGRSKYRVGSKA